MTTLNPAMRQSNTTLSDSRVRLLDTAQQLFHQRGYKSVTMQQIARELGMRQASLYYHMPDGKEQLFVEVSARSFEQHRLGLQAAMSAAGSSLEDQLRAAATWFASQPPMSLLSMMHADMPALSEAEHALAGGAGLPLPVRPDRSCLSRCQCPWRDPPAAC